MWRNRTDIVTQPTLPATVLTTAQISTSALERRTLTTFCGSRCEHVSFGILRELFALPALSTAGKVGTADNKRGASERGPSAESSERIEGSSEKRTTAPLHCLHICRRRWNHRSCEFIADKPSRHSANCKRCHSFDRQELKENEPTYGKTTSMSL